MSQGRCCAQGVSGYGTQMLLWLLLLQLPASTACAAPPESLSQIRKSLAELLAMAEHNSELARDIWMRGTLGRDDLTFLFVRKADQARFEVDYAQNGRKIRCMRLDDGQSLFKMDGNSLSIDSRNDLETKWCQLTHELSVYQSPNYSGIIKSSSEWIRFLIDAIDGSRTDDLSMRFHSGLTESQILIEIENSEGGPFSAVNLVVPGHPRKKVFAMTFDRSQGYSLAGWESHDGNPEERLWQYDLKVENTFSEIAPGCWTLASGTLRIEDRGTNLNGEDRSPLVERSVVVTECQVGDFSVPEDLFSIHSFGVTHGCLVHDHRTNPISVFNYGGPSVDSGILNREEGEFLELPVKTNGIRSSLIALNLGIALIAVLWILRRRMRPSNS